VLSSGSPGDPWAHGSMSNDQPRSTQPQTPSLSTMDPAHKHTSIHSIRIRNRESSWVRTSPDSLHRRRVSSHHSPPQSSTPVPSYACEHEQHENVMRPNLSWRMSVVEPLGRQMHKDVVVVHRAIACVDGRIEKVGKHLQGAKYAISLWYSNPFKDEQLCQLEAGRMYLCRP
jgi:hypothetical protein